MPRNSRVGERGDVDVDAEGDVVGSNDVVDSDVVCYG